MIISQKVMLMCALVCGSIVLLLAVDNPAAQTKFMLEKTGFYGVYIRGLSWKFWNHATTIEKISIATKQSEASIQEAIKKQDAVLRSFDTDKIVALRKLLVEHGCSFEIREITYSFPDEQSKKQAELWLFRQALIEQIESELKGSTN